MWTLFQLFVAFGAGSGVIYIYQSLGERVEMRAAGAVGLIAALLATLAINGLGLLVTRFRERLAMRRVRRAQRLPSGKHAAEVPQRQGIEHMANGRGLLR